MAWLENFVDLLSDLTDIDRATVRAVLGIALLVLVVSLGWQVARSVGTFAKNQVQQRFWKDAGKTTTLIAFVLLVIAYAFFGGDQNRDLGQAALDFGKEQLATVLPLAILTQLVLLTGYWLLFGRLLGVPWATLAAPLGLLAGFVLTTVQLLLFTLTFAPLLTNDAPAWTPAAVVLMVPVGYLVNVSLETPADRQLRAETGRSRWRVPVRDVFLGPLVWIIVFGIVALLIVAGYWLTGGSAPSLAGVLAGELLVMVVLFLLLCMRFRADTLAEADPPGALFPFVDLSLTLAAGAIAVAGLPDAPVKLGPVPTWIIAVGPPVVVGLLVLLTDLLPRIRQTPRWWLCLFVSLLAGVLVWLVKPYLVAALTPLVHALLPFAPAG